MAVTNFITTVWSARLLDNLNKALVYGSVVNTDYEGQIAGQGSTVKINSIGDVTVGTYDKATGIGDPEQLNSAQTQLVIDQAKYFNFYVDDVDAAQMNVNLMNGAMTQAAYNLADVMDQYIASLYTGVDSNNTIGTAATPVAPTKADAYDYLVDLSVKLDEANVPKMGRFVVLPSWYEGLMLKDSRFVSYTAQGDQTRTNGMVGRAAGFDVRTSNNVPQASGKYSIIAGYKGAISFASAIDSMEAYRPEKYFGDAVRGLQLYGARLCRPSGIAVLTASKS